jgi:hypothetical protein
LNRDPEKHPSPGPIHLDLYTDEREHEVKRLLSLGATRPVLMGKWLGPGMHVNAIGASTPPFRELDSEAVARSRLYVDRRESAINEAEDFRVPRKEGIIGDEPITGELGEALLGRVPGRTRRDEITLSKSVGLAVEDLPQPITYTARPKQQGSVHGWSSRGNAKAKPRLRFRICDAYEFTVLTQPEASQCISRPA